MLECGLFTFTFAMAICGGRRPEEQMFDVRIMRQHLLQHLEDGVMRKFQRKMKGREAVRVYCRCRLQKAGAMILYDICWECMKLAKLGLHQLGYKWQCCNCN